MVFADLGQIMRSQDRDLSPQALTSIYDHIHSQLIETRSLYRQLPLHQKNRFKAEMGRLIHSTTLAKAAVKRIQGFKSTPEKRYELRRHMRDLAKRILEDQLTVRQSEAACPSPRA